MDSFLYSVTADYDLGRTMKPTRFTEEPIIAVLKECPAAIDRMTSPVGKVDPGGLGTRCRGHPAPPADRMIFSIP